MGAGVSGPADLTLCRPPPDDWTNRWVESKHKSDFGKFVLSSGKFYGDQEKDKGKRQGVGVQIEDDFLEEAVVSTQSLGFSQEPGSQGQVGEGKGDHQCPSRARVLGVRLTILPSHRAADKPRCPILRAVR